MIEIEHQIRDNQNKEIIRRLSNLETHVINMIVPFNSVSRLLDLLNKPVVIDDRNLNKLLIDFRRSIQDLIQAIKIEDIGKLNETLKPLVDSCTTLNQTLGEIKFIGKRLDAIEKKLQDIYQKPIKKQVELSFKCDGYELVKKTPSYDETEEPVNEDSHLVEFLNTLSEREKKVVIHRLGLLGEKEKTFVSIGKSLGVGRERVSQIYKKAIRKLRHPCRKQLLENVTNSALRYEILGQEM